MRGRKPKRGPWESGDPIPRWMKEANDPVGDALQSGTDALRKQLDISHRNISSEEAQEYLLLTTAPEALNPHEAAEIEGKVKDRLTKIKESTRRGGKRGKNSSQLHSILENAPDVIEKLMTGKISGEQARNTLKRRIKDGWVPSDRTLRDWRKKLATNSNAKK